MTDVELGRLERAPAYRAAADVLRDAILSGQIPQGSYLPTELALAEQLGVTRQTVREAIRLLENAGLIERGKQRRLRAARPSGDSLSKSYHQAMVLTGITYRELWELEITMEPGTAALAAARCDPDFAARLQDNIAATKVVLNDPEALAQADAEFHNLVARATGNRALQLARVPTISLLSPAYATVIKAITPGRRLLQAHKRIAAAIGCGDVEQAREWMHKHIVDFRRGCELAGLDLDLPVRPFEVDDLSSRAEIIAG